MKQIKIQELRIGNYIHPCSPPNPVIIPQAGIISRVFEIKWDGVELFNQIDKHPASQQPFFYEWNRISPISLTEEWLLRFGFIYVMGSYIDSRSPSKIIGCVHHVGDSSFTGKNGDGGIYQYRFDDVSVMSEFEYVHQLQNLYFALTGEELTLKSETTHETN